MSPNGNYAALIRHRTETKSQRAMPLCQTGGLFLANHEGPCSGP
jgi:hypothetical protein